MKYRVKNYSDRILLARLCSSEFGTCIITDAGRQKKTKNSNENTCFLVESRQITFYTLVLKVYINFQRKKNFLIFFTKLTGTIERKVFMKTEGKL
jgi:hypothetical protein